MLATADTGATAAAAAAAAAAAQTASPTGGAGAEATRSIGKLELLQATVRYLTTATIGLHNILDEDASEYAGDSALASNFGSSGKDVEEADAIAEITTVVQIEEHVAHDLPHLAHATRNLVFHSVRSHDQPCEPCIFVRKGGRPEVQDRPVQHPDFLLVVCQELPAWSHLVGIHNDLEALSVQGGAEEGFELGAVFAARP